MLAPRLVRPLPSNNSLGPKQSALPWSILARPGSGTSALGKGPTRQKILPAPSELVPPGCLSARSGFTSAAMNHYDFADRFRALYDQAVKLYASGKRGAETYFSTADQAFLAANGIAPQHLYDYAEDELGYGEPGYDRALAIELVRRDYFLNVQHGRPSAAVLDAGAMPAKSDAVRGIEWLPRLIPKTRAKLRGELPPNLMYCCGGDRGFFRTRNIHPAEFLSLVWRHDNDDKAIVDWVVGRAAAK